MRTSAKPPVIWLTPAVDQRLRHWVDLASGEMSTLGLVDEVAGGFLVSEVFLPTQVCGTAETELDQSSVAKLLGELDAAGVDLSRVRLWQHSHGRMNVFWSGTDESTIRALANGSWTLSLVVNKAGDRLARLDVWQPVHVTLDDLPVMIAQEDLRLREECERLFLERVREVVAPPLLSSRPSLGGALDLAFDEGRLDPRDPRAGLGSLDWDDIDDLMDPEDQPGGGRRVGR